MSISIKQLKLDMDECSADQPVSMTALGRLHRWDGPSYKSGESQRPEVLSLRHLGHRHGKQFFFLWLNAYLLPTIKWDVPLIASGTVDGAQLIMQRAAEIAWTCGRRYDAIGLCEVFQEASRDEILKNMNPEYPMWTFGPSGGTWKLEDPAFGADILTVQIASSGLLTMFPGPNQRIGDNREKFNNEGDRTRDADAWSNKGILQAVADTGFNTKLEIYSTHLIKGGDFRDISTEDLISIQTQQIDQLVDFIRRTHSPSNFIIVAGDFNIHADSGNYEVLRSRMEDSLGLEDVWTRYAESRYGAKIGGTNDPSACSGDPRAGCGQFADDGIGNSNEPNESGRIDYVFIQKPIDSHDINVDISRPRRRHFPRERNAPGYEKIQYLSDHAGIEFKLFLSSK